MTHPASQSAADDGQRKAAQRLILDALAKVQGVESVTIAGSFWESSDVSAISDIDVIVICRRLTRSVFDSCVQAAGGLDAAALGFKGRALRINSTFGPLKFDTPESLVLHLMIYDTAGHRDHVLRSPFTCHDWERSPVHAGPSLHEIYPVLKLQPRDFTGARRGLNDYIADLEKGVISYRRYSFGNGAPEQVLEQKPLDERHCGEYAFHIMRNTVVNYIKLCSGRNIFPDDDDLAGQWQALLPACAEFIPRFRELRRIKTSKTSGFPADTIEVARRFVERFHESFEEAWGRCPRLVFVRHAPTELNDGSFLGISRNPHISPECSPTPMNESFDRVLCSPMHRTAETAKRLAPHVAAKADDRLLEMNYGRAEGLTLSGLSGNFPEMIEAWKRGDDPRFPDGENTADVLARLNSFLADTALSGKDSTLVVTHNVVLRCLAGSLYGIPPQKWHKLRIPHLVPIEVLLRDGKPFINATTEIKSVLTDSLSASRASSVRPPDGN